MKKKVAIQGIAGSYHDIAARNYYEGEEIEIIPCDTFREVITTIKKDPSEFETVTLGGLIAQLAGKVPAVGEEVKFENLTLKVLSVEYYKVTQAEVTVSATQESA